MNRDEAEAALLQEQTYTNKESFESASDYDVSIRKPQMRSRALLLVHLGAFLLYTMVFLASLTYIFSAGTKIPLSREDLRNNPMKDAFKYESRTVGYNFEDINPFKGQSVAEIDKQWDYALNGPHELRLSGEEMSNSNLSSIKLADGKDEYMVTPIAYHMLHCLYSMYRYAHPDFYGEDPGRPEWVTTHSDHCLDNIRQFVQCHAGAGISTFKWLPDRKIPYPVLNTEETCVDWERYDGWVRSHSIDIEDVKTLKGGHMLVHPTLGPVRIEDYQERAKALHGGHA